MSTVKSGGSSRNNRESESKRLGAKLSDGQFATAGSIIYRQRGTKVHPGNNVGIGGDDTLYCKIDGYVAYEQRRNRTYASVYENKPQWQIDNEKGIKPKKAVASKLGHAKKAGNTKAKTIETKIAIIEAKKAKVATKPAVVKAAAKKATAKPVAKAVVAKKDGVKSKPTAVKPAAKKAKAVAKPAAASKPAPAKKAAPKKK